MQFTAVVLPCYFEISQSNYDNKFNIHKHNVSGSLEEGLQGLPDQ
jgi:hypothetical protein